MDFEGYAEKFKDVGPHPGLTSWHTDQILLYRCRDISETELRQRILEMSERLEGHLANALPENLEAETYQMASEFYDTAADCLESYLDGLEETLIWIDTGQSNILDSAKKAIARGDRDWNATIKAALEMERQFAELDNALLLSLGINPAN